MIKSLVCLIFALISFSVLAQPSTREGQSEFGMRSNLDFQGPNGDHLDLRIDYGWFLNERVSLRFGFQIEIVEDILPVENDYRARQLDASIQYYFHNSSNHMPFIGLLAGWRSTAYSTKEESGQSSKGLVFGPEVGYRFSLNDYVSIDTSLLYLLGSDDTFIVDFEEKDHYIYPAIGLRVRF